VRAMKTELLDFLNKVHVKGLVTEAVFETDGSVTVSQSGGADDKKVAVKELIVMGTGKSMNLGVRLGLSNLDLLIKIVSSLESADNMLNIELKESNLVFACRTGKYTFRLTDPEVIESLQKQRPSIQKLLDESTIFVDLDIPMITALKKAITNLTPDRISLYANEGKLEAIVTDDATKNCAVIELGRVTGEFKQDFNAIIITRVLEMAGPSGFKLYIAKDRPLFLKSGDFTYMVSFFKD
jgi:hypothetical protein